MRLRGTFRGWIISGSSTCHFVLKIGKSPQEPVGPVLKSQESSRVLFAGTESSCGNTSMLANDKDGLMGILLPSKLSLLLSLFKKMSQK